MRQKLHLALANPSKSNLHNVSVSVRATSDAGSPEGNRQRDIEMFSMQGTILSIVYSEKPTGRFVNTGLFYDLPTAFGTIQELFEITITPEDGDAVQETLMFSSDSQCMSVTRIKDGKVFLSSVIPQTDMSTGKYDPVWKSCK